MDETNTLTVGVSGLNANDNPGPGVAVIRCLREYYGVKVKIIGLAYESLEPGIYMNNMVDDSYQIPYPGSGTAALLERIEWVHQRVKFDVIIPNFDAELYNFIKIAPQLLQAGIKTFLPLHGQLTGRDKVNLKALGNEAGFKVPDYQLLNHVNDIKEAAEAYDYPLVIKGRFYEASVVHTREAAQEKFYEYCAKWGLPVIAQQYVKGVELNVAGLGTGTGDVLSVVPMRKLYITDKGKAWAGVTVEDDELIALAKRFAACTKWKSGFELEIIREVGGELYVLEINPRFPAWVYLTAAAGQNQPAALVKMALGQPTEPFPAYTVGKMFIRYAWDEIVDISKFQQFAAFGEMSNLN